MEDAAEEFLNQLHWLEMINEALHFRILQAAILTLDTHLQRENRNCINVASLHVRFDCLLIRRFAMCLYNAYAYGSYAITGDFYFSTRATISPHGRTSASTP